MKRVLSVLGICLLITLMSAPSTMAMGRAKEAKMACGCPQGKCACATKADAMSKEKLPCGCPVGKCQCAPKKAEHPTK